MLGAKVSQVRIYSIKAEEDFLKISDKTKTKEMLDTVREFCNRFFLLLRGSISFWPEWNSSHSIRILAHGIWLEGKNPNL